MKRYEFFLLNEGNFILHNFITILTNTIYPISQKQIKQVIFNHKIIFQTSSLTNNQAMMENNKNNVASYNYSQGNDQQNTNISSQQQYMAQNQRLNNQICSQQPSFSTISYPSNANIQTTQMQQHQNYILQRQQQHNFNRQIQQQQQVINQQMEKQWFSTHSQQQQVNHTLNKKDDNVSTTELEIEDDLLLENDDFEFSSDDNLIANNGLTSNNDIFSSRATKNKGEKRSITGQDENNEISNSPIQVTNNKKTKPDDHSIAPIIYFRIDFELVKKPLLLEKKIMDALEKSKIILKSIKVTQNGNLLVYPSNIDDKKNIIENRLLFPECKLCDLEKNIKKNQLIVKGINAENFGLRYNSGITQKYKICNIIEIKKKDGTILNVCKIELESKEEFERLLQVGTIQLGLFSYKVEQVAKSPLRCHNCKEFGHSIKSCNKTTKCAKCGRDSHDNECENNITCCINCGDSHSSYFKGCPAYKDQMKTEIAKANETKRKRIETESNNETVPQGFKRNYSAVTNPINNINHQIKLNFEALSKQLQNTLNDSIKNEMKSSINEFKQEVKSLVSKAVCENNERICYFLIDVVRAIQPNLAKPNNNMIDVISSRFNHHNMGKVSTKNLNEYVTKLWT